MSGNKVAAPVLSTTITAGEAVRFITGKGPGSSRGRFFTVKFRKRTTGEVRTMNARYGVKSKRKGGEPAYDFASKGLVCVYEPVKDEYRSIPVEGLLTITINGKEVQVTHE